MNEETRTPRSTAELAYGKTGEQETDETRTTAESDGREGASHDDDRMPLLDRDHAGGYSGR